MNIVEQFSPRLIGGFLAVLGRGWSRCWFAACDSGMRAIPMGRAREGTVPNSLVKRGVIRRERVWIFPLITYTYEVDGAAYEGGTFTYQRIDAKKKIATKMVGESPKGQLADVYYDPSDPYLAVLLPGLAPVVM